MPSPKKARWIANSRGIVKLPDRPELIQLPILKLYQVNVDVDTDQELIKAEREDRTAFIKGIHDGIVSRSMSDYYGDCQNHFDNLSKT